MNVLGSLFKVIKKDGVDIYIVSYPKTGRTWLRYVLCSYLESKYKIQHDEKLDLCSLTRKAKLPCVEFTHDQAHMVDKLPYTKMFFDVKKYEGKSVVFLGRDFKDTLVSAYHQATKRNIVFEGTISEFIRDDRFGVKKLARFYEMWRDNIAVTKRHFYLSYEDMHDHPHESFRNVLKFIGEVSLDEQILQQSVHQGSFDNMREAEKKLSVSSSILKPGDINDPDSYKTRRGKIGGFTEELSTEDIDFIDEAMKELDLDSFRVNRLPD